MDPDCAICNQPARARCNCEARGLDTAVRQAEERMMSSTFKNIRVWVRSHAKDYILAYFAVLTSRRTETHTSTIRSLNESAAYHFNARPHPSDIHAADAALKRGIDEDWRASVQRYPEVLQYFYSLVELGLPADDEACVRDPPLSALAGGGARRARMLEERERERDRGSTGASVPPLCIDPPSAFSGSMGPPMGRGRRSEPLIRLPAVPPGLPPGPGRGVSYPYGAPQPRYY